MTNTFRALEVTESNNNTYEKSITERPFDSLPEGDVLIRVSYSSLNYKDALSATGNRGVTQNYPHTPGIDAAGTVVKSTDSRFNKGDKVIVTGYDLGMNTSGGYSEFIRVPADWVVMCPSNLSLYESMIYGTAGFTAGLSIYKMIKSGVQTGHGDILVTGATGGVGSIAISILSKLGYNVIAVTGKSSEKEKLLDIGAADVISRDDIADHSGRPILKARWAGAIDTVGGDTLANVIKAIKYNGCVTCCGNVGGQSFTSSIYPFILRGVSLIGIDSVQCPADLRLEIWRKLGNQWKLDMNNIIINNITLEELPNSMDMILNGTHVGRTVVSINAN